ncbi:sugar transferase [Leuconostoc mesenteroides]|uniref:sugar transferase n=1 Tax=Leuconostoc mesenteroides TaxID=1245 RepID=UPI0023606311|nr:sugar transferase [Leuconostoc mesenteroides]
MDTTVLGKTIYKNYIKKIFDLLMATFLIIVLLPVLLVVYIILRVTTDDTVIYKQDRVGQYGKVFQIYKFRTMPKNTPILVGKQRAQKSINWTIFIQLLRQHLRYDCDYKN